MPDPDLKSRCEELAAAKRGEFQGPSRTHEGMYEVLIVVPPGAQRETADQVFWGGGNTTEDAMRSLLAQHD